MKQCQKCGANNPEVYSFCGRCGERLPPPADQRICAKCKNVLPKDMIFCDKCGEKWESASAPAKPTTSSSSSSSSGSGCGWVIALIVIGVILELILN